MLSVSSNFDTSLVPRNELYIDGLKYCNFNGIVYLYLQRNFTEQSNLNRGVFLLSAAQRCLDEDGAYNIVNVLSIQNDVGSISKDVSQCFLFPIPFNSSVEVKKSTAQNTMFLYLEKIA